MQRCSWVSLENKDYVDYHDNEWGVPVFDDKIFFEFLVLEGAQAGLSWETIIKRRGGYRKAFSNFNPKTVAAYSEQKILELINNPEIIRNKLKIRSAVKNAKLFLEIQNEFGSFSKYIWNFVNNKPVINLWKNITEVPIFSKEAEILSKDLKKRGFSFIGPTIIYAFMQATGIVNDHTKNCFRHKELLG
ncbi:DNA-3-methyladenine glycosylase I [Candidatus Woesebacteria bacterium]|nr:DNA-3-methyladenine glycosylase I [Candidatus Woesebacteria bacterium]